MSLQRSNVLRIRCGNIELVAVQSLLPYTLINFPCKYLGLPLFEEAHQRTNLAHYWQYCWSAPWLESRFDYQGRKKGSGSVCAYWYAHLSCYGFWFSTLGYQSSGQNLAWLPLETPQRCKRWTLSGCLGQGVPPRRAWRFRNFWPQTSWLGTTYEMGLVTKNRATMPLG